LVDKVVRLYHTLKYLKLKQVIWRIIYLLPRFISIKKNCPEIILFPLYSISKNGITKDYDYYSFLNETHQLSIIGWDNSTISKLWRYNLHYFDFLRQNNQNEKSLELQKDIIDKWISDNPYAKGTGWEPYPTSLRIINWIKWHQNTKGLSKEGKLSLWNQTLWLANRPEYHLLGNHLFVNAKALLFACVFFGLDIKSNIYRKAINIISKELDEQFLDDGAHFELSPMYHALAMEDLLDLLQLSSALSSSLPREKILHKYMKGMQWLSYMKYENDELSHFNDCANGIAPSFKDLNNLAVKIGLNTGLKLETNSIFFKHSGFVVIKDEYIHLIADIGKIGPEYLPGHAHADSLSFELSIMGHRVIVNSGTSEYGLSNERLRQRSTSAHSTIEIDSKNSSEVWSGFRVARRANVFDINIDSEDHFNKNIRISACHDGYKRLKSSPIHKRIWNYNERSLFISDFITGNKNHIISRFYFHPEIQIIQKDKYFFISKENKNLAVIEIQNAKEINLVHTTYHDKFGHRRLNECIEVHDLSPSQILLTIKVV
jgi:uncharacterized heparinase superfamily protein